MNTQTSHIPALLGQSYFSAPLRLVAIAGAVGVSLIPQEVSAINSNVRDNGNTISQLQDPSPLDSTISPPQSRDEFLETLTKALTNQDTLDPTPQDFSTKLNTVVDPFLQQETERYFRELIEDQRKSEFEDSIHGLARDIMTLQLMEELEKRAKEVPPEPPPTLWNRLVDLWNSNRGIIIITTLSVVTISATLYAWLVNSKDEPSDPKNPYFPPRVC